MRNDHRSNDPVLSAQQRKLRINKLSTKCFGVFVGMPQDTYNIWFPHSYHFTQTICILQGLLSETSTNATVLTIASFTIERYIAICHPFRFVETFVPDIPYLICWYFYARCEYFENFANIYNESPLCWDFTLFLIGIPC